MTKELSTLDKSRPTTLDEKRRIQRELGLQVDPAMVMPRSSRRREGIGVWRRFTRWLKGAPQ